MENYNVEPYNPSKEIENATLEHYKEFQYCLDLRNKTYREFDDMTPDQYWSEARKRVKNYLPPKPLGQELIDVFLGRTRNKRNVIAAFVAAQRPRVDIMVQGGEKASKNDKRLATMLRVGYDWSMDHEGADIKFMEFATEALDVGTAVLQESYDFRVKEVKTLEEEDLATGKKIWKKRKMVYRDQCTATVVPIEDLYIQNFYEPDINEQPPYFIREYIPRVIAEQRYGKRPNWKYVPYGNPKAFDEKKDKTFFFQLLEDRVEASFVEILHRYDIWNDTVLDYANGVLLSDLDNPNQFDHKRSNLVTTVYERIGTKFFYGMSLPMKVVSEQDAFNELGNNNLNRSRISSIPKAISDYETEIDQSTVGTFEIITSSPEAHLREFSFESVKPGDMNFMQFMGSMLDEATVSTTFSGAIAGVTATEIMNNRQQNIQNLGQFLVYLYEAARNHADLRLQNLLQYFFKASKKYAGKEYDTKEIALREKLQDGTDGLRIVRVYSNKDKITAEVKEKDDKRGLTEIRDKKTGKVIDTKREVNYDYIYVTPDDVAGITYTVNIVPGSSLPETESLKKALMLELVNTMSQPQFAGQTDFGKLQQMVVEAFGYSIDDIRPDQSPEQQTGQQGVAQLQQAAGQLQAGSQQQNTSDLVQQITGTGKQGLDQLMGKPQ